MILGIMSDSHGDLAAVRRAVEAVGAVDLWLHAGDCSADVAFLSSCAGVRAVGVAGNCDGLAARVPKEEYLDLEGVRVFLTHGHAFGVKSGTDELVDWARRMDAGVAVYGHTHIPEVSQQGALWIVNPGSAARPRLGAPTAARAVIEDGRFAVTIVEIC